MFLRFLLSVVILLQIFVHSLVAQDSSWAPQIKQVIEQHDLASSHWSFTVRDSTGRAVVDYNGNHLMRPASNLKLLTSFTILDALGPDFQFETTIYGRGQLVDSTWQGDLIVRGVGDPSIGGDLYNGDRFYVFKQLSDKLHEFGIRKVTGDLIGNNTFFDDIPYPKGWDWDDLHFYYGVEIDALSFNNNCVDLTVKAEGPVGDPPAISWFPFNTDLVSFLNEQLITPKGTDYEEDYRRLLGTNTIILRSRLPKGYLETECLSITNPAYFFLDSFHAYLEKSGFVIEGSVTIDEIERFWQSDEQIALVSHRSEPIAVMLDQINKESNNFYTEMLLKASAATKFGPPGSTGAGLRLMKQFAASMAVDTLDLVLSDGSGMSSRTLTTTRDLSNFLSSARSHPHFPEYYNSLSVAGVDGTLSYRMINSELSAKIRGKSGYMSGVRSLSGYITTHKGSEYAFSLITNHYRKKTRVVDRAQEAILELIYRTL